MTAKQRIAKLIDEIEQEQRKAIEVELLYYSYDLKSSDYVQGWQDAMNKALEVIRKQRD